MNLPVILIHRGDAFFLKYVFLQLRHSNPSNEIILIGDSSLKKYERYVSFYEIKNFTSEAEEFSKVYQHLSPNGYEYELFCFQRWYILQSFLIQKKIERCLYLDSDVLFYGNVNTLNIQFENYDLTIAYISPHINFLNLTGLQTFCNYMKDTYLRKDSAEFLSALHKKMNEKFESGISDMTFFWQFHLSGKYKVLDLLTFNSDEETFDLNIHSFVEHNQQYESDGQYIKVVWKKEIPFFINKAKNKKIQVHALHFQGSSKKSIPKYIAKKNAEFYSMCLADAKSKLLLNVKNLLRKMYNRTSQILNLTQAKN